jgi:hypothetical protein
MQNKDHRLPLIVPKLTLSGRSDQVNEDPRFVCLNQISPGMVCIQGGI